MPFEGGPYIQAACLCEMTIEDKTNTLSLIRIIDTLTQTASGPQPPEDMPPLTFRGKLVLMLKSGRARGRNSLTIRPELPSGEAQTAIAVTVHFEGEEKGQNIVTNLSYTFTQEGLYWFNVYLGENKMTAIPVRVKYNRIMTGVPPSSE
jgi:hypothetical protein